MPDCEFCGARSELRIMQIPICPSCDRHLSLQQIDFLGELLRYRILSEARADQIADGNFLSSRQI